MTNRHELITPLDRLTEAEFEVYNLAVAKHKKAAIKMEDFDNADMPDDFERVARLEKEFQKDARVHPELADAKKRGEILEALLSEQIELENWLGGNAETITPSRYDDLINGVDLLVEFESEEGFFKHLALSVDATTSRNAIAEKIDRIRKDIQRGHLALIKYFYSPKTKIRGRQEDVPKVVVGADAATVRELSGLWLNLSRARAAKMKLEKEEAPEQEIKPARDRIRSLQKQLGGHRMQFQILREIEIQLKYFIMLAENQKKDELVTRYQNTLSTIKTILEEKEIVLSEEDEQKIQQDDVFREIMKEVS